MNKIIFSILLILSLFISPFKAHALFGDYSNLEENEVSADTLDFKLLDDDNDEIDSDLFDEEAELLPEETFDISITKTFKIQKEGGLDFDYRIKTQNFSGNGGVCDALYVKVEQNDDQVYSGVLDEMEDEVLSISNSIDTIDMEIYLVDDDPGLENSTCDFDIKVEAWQTNSDGSWGFIDEEGITDNIVYTGEWLPWVEVTSPNGGEAYSGGDIVNITWDSLVGPHSSSIELIDIELSENSGIDYNILIASNESDDGSYLWTIPNDLKGEHMRIRITVTDDNGFSADDESDADFDPKPKDDDSSEEGVVDNKSETEGESTVEDEQISTDAEEFEDKLKDDLPLVDSSEDGSTKEEDGKDSSTDEGDMEEAAVHTEETSAEGEADEN